MGRKYGYHSYRGRSPLRILLKVLAGVLALLLAVFLATILFLGPYWSYSSEGAKLRLPWNSSSEPAPPTDIPQVSTQPSELVVVTPAPTQAPHFHALALPREALSDGSANSRLSAVGANAAVFDMKADDGSLGYLSGLVQAVSGGVNPSDDTVNNSINALNQQDGLYTVARVSCFRDNTIPRQNNKLAIRSPSGNWRDSDGVRWLSPYSEGTRQYITGICLELAGLGFDEILLDNASYPTDGNLNYILKNDAYSADNLNTVVSQFYTELSASLKVAYPDVTLSVVTDGATILSGSSAGGQALSSIAPMDRIWVRNPGTQMDAYARLLEENGLTNSATGLVPLSDSFGQDSQNWAVWWKDVG